MITNSGDNYDPALPYGADLISLWLEEYDGRQTTDSNEWDEDSISESDHMNTD